MPLKKLLFRPGVNRENTRYASETLGSGQASGAVAGWYECDKIRFRYGTPEKIGGWQRISSNTFTGVCRSLWNWQTLNGLNIMGVGTDSKFYGEYGGAYYDLTPIRSTATLTNPFTATNGSAVITVNDLAHGCVDGDTVTFSGAGITGLGGNITATVLKGSFTVTVVDTNNYTITVGATANATDAAGSPGGGTVIAQYAVNVGGATALPLAGWGSGGWGTTTWGGSPAAPTNGDTATLRVWNQQNFGEDLIYGPNGGALYYWDATIGLTARTFTVTIASPGVLTLPFTPVDGMVLTLNTTGALPTGLSVGTAYYVVNAAGLTCQLSATAGGTAINTSGSQSGTHTVSQRGYPLTAYAGASEVPTMVNYMMVSDASRFVIAFGCNDIGGTELDAMLVRWSDQEDPGMWMPGATNQAGFFRLSRGSMIVTAVQTRQEIVVFTDAAVYSMQFLGAPDVWGQQLLADNTSIASRNAATVASGVVYWMGTDKFYVYDGSVKTLPCDLRQYVFGDINRNQYAQIFCGGLESFNEVWWFYCSEASDTIDRYVVYNYLEGVWYYGTLARTAWIDASLRSYPVAATYSNNLVNHESGTDDGETASLGAIHAYISSAEFDIDDGHNFGFVYRVLPDLTFRGSTGVETPEGTLTLIPLKNSGSGYNDPQSVGGNSSAGVQRIVTAPVEEFTGQVFVRVRGRQMVFKFESNKVGTQWQLGAPRIDIRPDGRRA